MGVHRSVAPPDECDRWYDWLLRVRHGGDAAYAAMLGRQLEDIRDRVLDHARVRPGDRVADIGSGDGLVGFEVLERQPDCHVIFIDISPALVGYVRDRANARGVAGCCRFVIASAHDLHAIETGSVDVVTVRAVLAYIADKAAAIAEFHRILRPGGRLSIVDPIFQDRAYALAGIANQLRATDNGRAARYLEFVHRWRSAHWPDTIDTIQADPLTNYNERDLLRLCENAGFADIHLRLHVDSVAALPMPWPVFLASAPRAGTAVNGEVLMTRFTPAERREFEQLFRAGIEGGTEVERTINAYIFAERP